MDIEKVIPQPEWSVARLWKADALLDGFEVQVLYRGKTKSNIRWRSGLTAEIPNDAIKPLES